MATFYLLIFIFGLSVGSFLNVLIIRLGSDELVKKNITGRSFCPQCRHELSWHDLIPLLSFFLLGGKCRYCGKKISWQYPIVELVTGILFVFLWFYVWLLGIGHWELTGNWKLEIGNLINFIYLLFITSCLVVIFVSDLRFFIIPDEVIWWGIGVTFVYQATKAFNFALLNSGNKISQFLFPELVEGFKVFAPYLLSALGAFVFFLVIVVATKGRGMGLGDVKLAFLMGFLLGWPKIFIAIFLAFWAGALIGIALVLFKKANMKSEIPFGTFLAVSTFFVMIFGDIFFKSYINLIF